MHSDAFGNILGGLRAHFAGVEEEYDSYSYRQERERKRRAARFVIGEHRLSLRPAERDSLQVISSYHFPLGRSDW